MELSHKVLHAQVAVDALLDRGEALLDVGVARIVRLDMVKIRKAEKH